MTLGVRRTTKRGRGDSHQKLPPTRPNRLPRSRDKQPKRNNRSLDSDHGESIRRSRVADACNFMGSTRLHTPLPETCRGEVSMWTPMLSGSCLAAGSNPHNSPNRRRRRALTHTESGEPKEVHIVWFCRIHSPFRCVIEGKSTRDHTADNRSYRLHRRNACIQPQESPD
ncbi:MAG: hypothetical protein ACJAYU_004930 [Bradymonadia bacterium]|jgi:hypothetical protein